MILGVDGSGTFTGTCPVGRRGPGLQTQPADLGPRPISSDKPLLGPDKTDLEFGF
jgi:hypothetical protein